MGTNLSRIRRLGALVLAAPAMLMAGASPALAASASNNPDVTILRRLAFLRVDDMIFGNILPGTTAGTVVIAPDGTRTKTGGVTLMSGTSQPGAFAGWGTFNQNVQISMTANSYTLTRSGGTQTMILDTFIIGSTPTAQLTTNPRVFRIAATNGIFQFPLGATLRVNANQTPGHYAGTIGITLNYM